MTERRLRPITPAGVVRRMKRAAREVAKIDPDLARLLADQGPLDISLRPEGFATMVRAILAQQVSVKAAATMWSRIEARCGLPVTPEAFLEFGYDGCRGIGMTGRKSEYALGIAEATVSGALDFDALARMPDEAAIDRLTALRGVGRWTAEVYLLLSLGRPDVWPAADLALIVALGEIKGLKERPTIPEAAAIAEAWRPWRGAAALLLWRHYVKTPT